MSILIFSLGIIFGFTLMFACLWLVKVKCPQCKQLKPLQEIICWQWKTRTITGQACLKCRQIKPQIEL